MDNTRYLHLPIEQVVRRTDTRFQAGFATEAREMFPDNEEYVLTGSRGGLHILGRNEEALQSPVEILREVYGGRVEVRPPRARLIGGVPAQEPVMHVRISLEKWLADDVKLAMQRRGAALEAQHERAIYCVLRYQAPLARLLGLPAELSELTGGRAKHWTALSHYAIVGGDGPGGQAA